MAPHFSYCILAPVSEIELLTTLLYDDSAKIIFFFISPRSFLHISTIFPERKTINLKKTSYGRNCLYSINTGSMETKCSNIGPESFINFGWKSSNSITAEQKKREQDLVTQVYVQSLHVQNVHLHTKSQL